MKLSGPKLLLHSEGLVVLIAASYIYRQLGASWLMFALVLLAPDLSMLGYVFGSATGARAYNLAHTYAAPFLLAVVAHFAGYPTLLAIAVIWLAHIGLDRLVGYGLKYETNFKDTHLQRV